MRATLKTSAGARPFTTRSASIQFFINNYQRRFKKISLVTDSESDFIELIRKKKLRLQKEI